MYYTSCEKSNHFATKVKKKKNIQSFFVVLVKFVKKKKQERNYNTHNFGPPNDGNTSNESVWTSTLGRV